MTGGNSNRLVLELVEGTKFDPRLSGNDDPDLGPAERVAETVRSYIELISKKYHVAKLAKLLRRHSVSKTRIDNGSYEFKVDYDGWRYPNPEIVPISSTALFSVLLTSGICEWRPRGGSWTRRQIELEERIRFGIFAGPNDDVFGAFSIHPAIVYPRDRESGLPECLSRIFPQDLDRPWIESEGTVGLFVGVDDDGETEAGYEPLFDVKEEDVSVVRLPDDHGLDLTGFRNRWADRGRETEKRKVKGSKFRINRCFFSGKLDRASVGSVSKWLDQPLKSIRRRQGDALAFYDPGYDQDRPTGPTAPKHDASRGISPPDTILAEIEVSLFYDGYQGRFDEDDKFLVDEFYNWEMDDDGEMFPVVEKIDLTHDDTFLDRIEYDVAAQVNGLVKWLRDSREETVKRSDDLLKSIDDELQKLLAEEDGGSNK